MNDSMRRFYLATRLEGAQLHGACEWRTNSRGFIRNIFILTSESDKQSGLCPTADAFLSYLMVPTDLVTPRCILIPISMGIEVDFFPQPLLLLL
jgi:hypothetical protein